MKKNLLLLLLVNMCLLAACSKTEVDLPFEPPELTEVYVFDNITFTNPDSEQASRLTSFPRTGFIFTNGTSVVQTALLNYQQQSTSSFTYDAGIDSLLKGIDTNYVQVPVSVADNGQFILGAQTWPLVKGYITHPQQKDPVRLSVAPYTEVNVTGTITEMVLKANFVVTLKGQQTGAQKKVFGTWEGMVPVSEDLDYSVKQKN